MIINYVYAFVSVFIVSSVSLIGVAILSLKEAFLKVKFTLFCLCFNSFYLTAALFDYYGDIYLTLGSCIYALRDFDIIPGNRLNLYQKIPFVDFTFNHSRFTTFKTITIGRLA